MEYPKINTLFERDLETFKVCSDKLKMKVVDVIKYWQVTEKIDGTNIRIILDINGNMLIRGRTDKADLRMDLIENINKIVNAEKLKYIFWDKEGENEPTHSEVVLFGEGYGSGIQKGGGNYNSVKSFRLFDVLVGDKFWLNWENTCDIANKLGIKTVPYLGIMTLEEIIPFVKNGFESIVAKEEGVVGTLSEGIVGRTVEPLFTNRGRLIIKLKQKDF